MVAIITGNGTGLERSSASILGSRGQLGSAALGRDGEGVYVNAATGNLVISRQDEVLIGLGPDVSLNRTYNSQATSDGDNNDNWRESVYRKVTGLSGAYGAAGTTVTQTDWDGSEIVYTWNASYTDGTNTGFYVATDGAGAYDTLRKSGSTWTWTDGTSQATDLYDDSNGGRITYSKDTDLNTLTYAYNGAGLITQVTDQNGEYTKLVYGGTSGNQLQQLETYAPGAGGLPTLTRVLYTYDTSNRLSTVTVDLSPNDRVVTDGNKYVTTYTYDGASLRVASIGQSDGSLLQIAYSTNGSEYRVTQLTETVAAGVTRVTGIYYDTANRVTTVTDPLGGVTTMSYDVKGNLTQLVLPVPTPGAAAPTTSFTYNGNGDVLSMTAGGRTVAYDYDSHGNMILSRDAAGNTVTRTYSLKNELLISSHYLAPDPDGAGGQAANTPVTTRYAYDLESHLRFTVNPEGEVTEYRYDGPGRLVSTISYPANSYNISALAPTTGISEADLIAWVNGIADKSNVRRTDTSYDATGKIWTVTSYAAADSNGIGIGSDFSRDIYVYDQAGQLLSRVNNASSASEVFVYDGLGRVVSSTDMANATTTFAFNDTATTTTVTLANGLTRASVYDKAGELISVTESGGDIATALTTEAYDALGRLRMVTDATNRRTYYVYDNASRKVAEVTADGAMTEYGYDASNRLVKTIGYVNRLAPSQIDLLDDFTAGGAGGAGMGGISGGLTGSSLLVNGSFETSGGGYTNIATGRSNTTLPNWTKANPETFEQVSSGQMGVTASDGSFWLDLDSVAGSGAQLPFGSNLVLNGSFDTSGSYVATTTGRSNTTLPNWTKTNPETFEQVTSGQMGVTGTDGAFWLDMDSVAGSGYAPVGGNLLVNGSFDTSGSYTAITTGRSNTNLPSWTKTNPETFEQVTSGQMGVTGSDGAYWLDLESVAGSGAQLPVGANLLANGSFDTSGSYTATATGRSNTDLPNWTKANPETFEQVASGQLGVTGTNGAYWLDLDSIPASAPIPTGGNLLQNGSFEESGGYTDLGYGRSNTTLPNWTNNNGETFKQVASGQFGVTASNGAYWLDLESVPGSGIIPIGTNRLVNGSFDQSGTYTTTATGRSNTNLTGWTKVNPETFEQVTSGQLGVTGTDGAYWLDLDSIPGSTYVPVGGNLLLNGSFDISGTYTTTSTGRSNTNLPNWTKANSETFEQVASGQMGVTGTDGAYWLDLDSVPTDPVETPGANLVNLAGWPSNPNSLPSGAATVTGWQNTHTTQIDSSETQWAAVPPPGGGANVVAMRTGQQDTDAAGGGNITNFATIDASQKYQFTYYFRLTTVGLQTISMGLDVSAPIDNAVTGGSTTGLFVDMTASQQTAAGLVQNRWYKVVGYALPYGSANVAAGSLGGMYDTVTGTKVASTQIFRWNVPSSATAGARQFNKVTFGSQQGFTTDWLAPEIRQMAMSTGGNMDISQTVGGLTAGQVMQIQFDHANRTTATSGSFEVWWNNTLVATINSTGTAMQSKTYQVAAIAGNNTLRFKGTGTADSNGASIDNVRLFATQNAGGGGNMDIRQTVEDLTAGQIMLLQFDHANRTTAASGSFEVYWNNTLVATVTDTGTTMQTNSYQVTAVAGDNVLRFKGTGTVDADGASVDNVRLFATQTAPDGGSMDISQTVILDAGQVVQLQFDHANRSTSAGGSFEVWWNNTLVATITDTGTTMQTNTYLLTAIAGDNTIRFKGTGTPDGAGASIDNVRLFETYTTPNGGNMDISQTVSGLSAGQIMQIQFDHANRTTSGSGSFEVWWNSTLVATINSTGTTMVGESYQVAAIAGTNTLRFKGTGTVDANGASIDNVRLFATQTDIGGGNMDISQTVSGLTAGQVMQIQFDHANRTSAASGSFEVWWNSTLVATINSTNTTMVGEIYQVVAAAGNNTLRFKGTGTVDAAGASIDNVRLFATQPIVGGGNMDISQAISGLTAGQVMQLQFDHANRTSAASGSFEVWWNTTLVATINSTGTTMVGEIYQVVAAAGTNTLRFKGTGTVDANGASIDNVRLFATQTDVGGGNMDISQAVNGLTAGQNMLLQFDHANRTTAASGSFEVWWNTTLVATINSTGTTMQTENYSVTAIAGTNTLRFKGIGTVDANGASIDNVRLFATQGAPGGGGTQSDALLNLRPTASATDAWNWNVYDSADRVIETIDATGSATIFTYDGDSRLVSTKSYANAIAAATVAGFKTTAPTALVLPATNTATDRFSRSFYDNDGRVIATLDGAGGLTQFIYDEDGRKVRELGAAKAADSNLLETHPLAEIIASVGTSASDRRADFVYDGRGNLRFTIDAAGSPTEFVYDGGGRIIRTVAYAGSIAPAASYSLAYVQAQLSGALGTNAANRITRTTYDAAGRAAFTIDAGGAVTAFAFDSMGNVTKATAYATLYTVVGDQSVSTMASWATGQAGNSANRISRSIFDAAGQTAYAVDAEGYVTEHQYDVAGRVTKDIRYAASYGVGDGATKASVAALIGALPADAVSIIYTYDAAGRLTDVMDGINAVTHYVLDGLGQAIDTIIAYNSADASTTHRVFDAVGAVTSETRGYGTADAATTVFAYDRVGNLLTVTDPLNVPTTWSYDSVGRVLAVTVQVDGNTANDLITSYQYDAFGNVVRVNDPRLNDSFVYYDTLGRAWLQVDAEGYATKTLYTAFGEAATVTRYWLRPSGTPTVAAPPTIVTDSRDATTTFGYDKLGRLTSVTDAEAKDEAYIFNAFGDRVKVRNKLGSGLVPTDPTYDNFAVTYTYDKLGRELSETLPVGAWRSDGTAQPLAITNKFEYDSRGNRTRMTEAFGLVPDQRITNYVYDKADRVTDVTHDQVLTYDQNLSSSYATPAEHYDYNLRGDLTQSIDAGGGKTISWYDALGCKTFEVSAVGTLSKWTYDGNGNLHTARVYADAVAVPAGPGGNPPSPAGTGTYRETTFGYDRANRQISTTTAPLVTGVYVGGNYVTTASGAISTSVAYDRNGNVVRQTDGIGYADLSWYDRLGNKVAQVDREGYLTTWTRDTNSNASTETRYANRITASYNEATAASTLPGLAGASASDRTTGFTYDRNGRRLTETRSGVVAWTVNGLTLSADATDATIIYTYNALGEVASKTEANGDVTNFGYDNAGRLTWVKEPTIQDNDGASVRRMTETFYDGLGDVVRVEVNKEGGAVADDRVTSNIYAVGGRLFSTTDAGGFTRSFGYDAAGRVVVESFTRFKSDGSTVSEGSSNRYDLAGRLLTQTALTWNGSAWVFGASSRMLYNAFGELTGRGLTGGPGDAAVYQETFDYDAGGRVWRSNAGDGTTKILFYDKAGNATLILSSAGADLPAYADAAAALAALNTVGGTNIANAVTTITAFDHRGLQIQSVAPDRQLTSSTSATAAINRSYNAFGELISESDARNAAWLTEYSYNSMGRLIEKKSPSVNYTSESGAVASARPTETYYYDISGRLVGVRDANNDGTANYTTRTLLAGTGHDGGDALVTAEYHLDGGVARTFYDAFGDARLVRNELLNSASTTYNAPSDELYTYDKMGRITDFVHRGNLLTDHFTYDGLGQRTGHWNNVLGSGNVERTDYDVQGRVVSTVAFGGDTTATSYAWSSTLATSGLGTFGGWVSTTTYANSKTLVQQTDMFGHLVAKTDLGGHAFTYAYDKGARMTSQAVTGETLTYGYLNTGLVASISNGGGSSSSYGYDAAGNKVSEWTQRNYAVVQNATTQYDALNRMTSWTEAGSTTTPASTMTWEYDRNSNIRHSDAYYWILDQNGAPWVQSEQSLWYRFDSMNRVVTEGGWLDGTQIARGDQGTDYLYNTAGQRVRATTSVMTSQQFWDDDAYDPNAYNGWGGYTGNWVSPTYADARREDYGYDDSGNLATVRVAQSTATYDSVNDVVIVTEPTAAGALKSNFYYDGMGRVTDQIDWLGDGATNGYERIVTYNAAGQISNELDITRRWNSSYTSQNIYKSYVTNTFGAGSSYALGAVLTSTVYATIDDADDDSKAPDTLTTNTYNWWDGAVAATSTYNPNTNNMTTWTTTYSYGPSGQLTSAYVGDGRPRTITFTNDMAGQALRRDEADNNYNTTTGGDPHEVWYRFNGKQIGYTGNNGSLDTDYQSSIDNRLRTPSTGAFQFGWTSPSADFDQSLNAINSFSQGGAGGSYTARAGDTLQSVAANLWGDSSLWYKLAEANGLSAGGALVDGQRLTIPSGVMKSGHSASTFQPYDPSDVLGNTSPMSPKPPKSNKCAVVGQILVAVIAIAVAALLPEIAPGIFASGALGGFGAAATAMAASAISQGIGVATGLQDKFSWKGVALAGITAGIGSGLDKLAGIKRLGFLNGGTFASDVARSTIANVASQGVAVATGLQSRFNWAGVAAAGVVGGVMGAAARGLPAVGLARSSFGNQTLSSAAGLFSGAAARSLLTGTDFGDNIVAVLPDVIAMTAGNALVRGIASLGLGRIELAQAMNAPVLPGTNDVQSDIVVTAPYRMNWAQRRLYDLETGITNALDDMENRLRAQAESSSLVVLTRLAAAGAERLGLHPVAQILTHTANLESGFQVGAGRAVIGIFRGVEQAGFHPEATAHNLLFAAGRGVDVAINANASDLRDAAVSGYHRARDTLARGDSTAVGEFLGGTAVAVVDVVVGSHGAGTVSRVGRFGEVAAEAAPVARPASILSRAAETEAPNVMRYTGRRMDVRAKFVDSPSAQASTPGHSFASRRAAYEMALNPEVERVTMNAGYKRLLRLDDSVKLPNVRPDAAAVYFDGRIARTEIMSDGDRFESILIQRNTNLDTQLRNLGYKPLLPDAYRPTKVR